MVYFGLSYFLIGLLCAPYIFFFVRGKKIYVRAKKVKVFWAKWMCKAIGVKIDINFHKNFDTNKNYAEGGYVGEKYIDIIHREVVLQLCAPKTVQSCESYAYSFDNYYDEPNIFLAGTTEFAIGQYGLFIQFWEYDFGYSSGEELILIPWHDISITLNENGPYSDILKIYSQKNELATKYEPEWEFDN